jgi:signal transduction histidine kinase
MTLATDKNRFDPPPGTAAARLLERREDVMVAWLSRLRQTVGAATGEREPILVDTLPALLENLAEALAPNYPRELATEGTTIATEHGGERARLTRIAPADLIREYQILRDELFEALGGDSPLSERDSRIIIKSIDLAMSESLTAYFLVYEGLREQFSNILTHDLRNPLSAIKASADVILRFPDRHDQAPLFASRIVENVRRIDRMIEDLLDASRVRFGEKINFKVAEFELLSLIKETTSELSTVYGNRFVIQGEPVSGFWNRDAFQRAMENLLVNALKYGDRAKPVVVRLEKIHDRAIFSVRNEGPPIPAEEQEGLFQAFMRSHAAKGSMNRGWGLGLAMVRGMAEGHGGSVTVDSAPERGTTFVIDVPVDPRPHLNAPTTPGARPIG